MRKEREGEGEAEGVRGREDGEKKKERVDLGVTDDVW
jgi:hypothetical protein